MNLAVRLLSAGMPRAAAIPRAPRVLVPGYAGLGNFLLMTPLFRQLREAFPGVVIHLVAGNPWGAEHVLEGTGMVDRIHVLKDDAPWWRKAAFFLRLRGARFDVAFVPFDAAPAFYRFGVLLAGIPVRVGHTLDFLRQEMGWTRRAISREVPLRPGAHESDLHLDLLDALLPAPCARTYETILHRADRSATLSRFGLAPRGYTVLQVSAANAGTTPKRWPIDSFRELARRLHAEGHRLVLMGDARDRAIVDPFAATCGVPVLNLAGETTIAEAAALLGEARILVCHDSGLMHLGNAVGAPLIALYGPTDLTFTRPRAPTSRILRKETLPCIGCMKDFSKTEEEALRDCPRAVECMRSITVEEVLAVVRMIARR